MWLCDAVTDEREFSWCCQSSRRWAQILTKEVKKFLLLPSSSQLSKLRQSLWSLQKKCLQFILKLQERLILSVQRGNAKFNIHSENTLFQIVKNKKFGILCKYSAQLLFRMVTKDPTRWKSRWTRKSHKMQKPLQILFSSCLLFQIARTTDTESTTSPKGDSTSYLRNVQTCVQQPTTTIGKGFGPKLHPDQNLIQTGLP